MSDQPIIVFEVDFNVTQEAGSYNSFIRDLRRRVAEEGAFVRNVPMLNPEQEARNQWFHIRLAANDSSITLRIRYGDLYLVGFQAANGQWYEFQPQNDGQPHLIPGAVYLPYPFHYASSADIEVGRYSLTEATETLANFDPGNTRNREMLMRLMVMFPEALRFITVSDFVYERIHSSSSSRIGDAIDRLIHSWGVLSMTLRRADMFAQGSIGQHFINLGIQSVEDIVRILGLVLHSNRRPSPPSVKAKVKRSLATSNPLAISNGRPLVEVLSVQILNIDNENPGELYGTIQVVDGLDPPSYIFSRSSDNYLSIKPQEFIPLTGPTRAISAFDSFSIDVSLFDHDTLSPDDEVSKGQIVWNYFDNNIYDRPLTEIITGMHGSAAIRYAVCSDAVTANLEVVLISGDGEDPANVYGTLKANTFPNENITLFDQKSNEYIDIRPQQVIPLSRSVVVVPLDSTITIGADLWDQDTLSPDDSIAQGSVTFPADDSRSVSARISGRYGEIEVRVTWSSRWD